MPSKIPNLFNSDKLVISQGLHAQSWGFDSRKIAIDFSTIQDLICPFDGCEVKVYGNSGNLGQQSYFTITLPDFSIIICVHGSPIRTGIFKKGEVIGKCTWHHWHLSLLVGGKLECILDYIDRSITMITDAKLYKKTDHPDGKWETYQDKFLNFMTEVDKFNKQMFEAIKINVFQFSRERGYDLEIHKAPIVELARKGIYDIAMKILVQTVLDFIEERKVYQARVLNLENEIKSLKQKRKNWRQKK